MDKDQANLILDAMARTAIATEACFEMLAERPDEFTEAQLSAIEEYAEAKLSFDTAVRSLYPTQATMPYPREVH